MEKGGPQENLEISWRIGMDGVSLLKSHVVACAAAVCLDLTDVDMHSPK